MYVFLREGADPNVRCPHEYIQVLKVYWICNLRALVCIPESAAQGNTYKFPKVTNPMHPRLASVPGLTLL